MSTNHPSPIDQSTRQSESLWPLDLGIVALAGLVLYLILAQLRFDDPRWTHNGWTYVIAVPVTAFLLSGISRAIASQYVHKSLQLGFLFSLFVHLLLLILAINVVIFTNYFPDALTGIKRERAPIRRTIPEYVFRVPNQETPTPDWSQPVDAETASRVIPTEKRQIPPVDHVASKLELPRPIDPERRPMQKFLMKREQPSQSMPQPASSPGRLARPRSTENASSAAWSLDKPIAPDVKAISSARATIAERSVDSSSPSRAPAVAQSIASPAASDLSVNLGAPVEIDPSAAATLARSDRSAVPEVKPPQLRRRPQSIRRDILAAGASPSAPRVAIDRNDESSERVADAVDNVAIAKSDTQGADLSNQTRTDSSLTTADDPAIVPIAADRQRATGGADLPAIAAAETGRRGQADSRPTGSTQAFVPAGSPRQATGGAAAVGDRPSRDQQITDRLADVDAGKRVDRSASGQMQLPPLQAAQQAGLTLDLLLQDGPVGMASELSRHSGIVPGESVPEIAALEISPSLQRRPNLGGPVTPFGTKIAAVESFSRRIKRTEGSGAPTPAGAVGPATEEAIERGLAYLASVQNEDGSWSLQGHGSDVVLRSDTAATGLCLLAFQGAGYTHRQHQYADTVSRGLKFLLDNQKTNGDLYRSENRISNDNVALYSHGIAALSLCEAYGMTQDPELRRPAQDCIRYIVETQHRRRGGWRYTPQVSSDTSVTGWMMMALKSGQLAGLEIPEASYRGIEVWLDHAQVSRDRQDRYRYNPFAPDTPSQRHGRTATPTMTAVGMLMRMYLGWQRDNQAMQSAADYLMQFPPQMGSTSSPQRDGYYWYYATMVMFHMGDEYWRQWNSYLKPVLLESQIREGEWAGSWDPRLPVPDRWSPHAGRIYVTTMNLLNLEVYYRHLPIYDEVVN